MSRPTVLIAAAGSGGHLFPAQQLSELLKDDYEILFAGHKLGETPFFAREKIPFCEIVSAPFKRGGLFRFIVSLGKGFWQSLRLLRKTAPVVVVGFGSYHTFPILLAAAVLKKKIILFEANAAMGKVNRFFAPFSLHVALQFPLEKALKNQFFVPYLPWKKKGEKVSKEEALAYFGLEPSRCTCLVFGGSQGASFLNQHLPEVFASFPDLQVLHFTGKGQTPPVYLNRRVCVKEFESKMEFAYAAADIAICRSGAGTLAELIRSETPALLIPFPKSVEDHQMKNAIFFVNAVQGGRLLAQKEACCERMRREIQSLCEEREKKRASIQVWNRNRKVEMGFSDLVYKIVEGR